MTDPKPKRDLDERTAIPLDPEEAVRALLQVDPESEAVEDPACSRCGHPMSLHRETVHGRQVAITCQLEGCDCHYDVRR